MANIVNGRCYAQKAPAPSPPLFQHGKLALQAHHIGWLISGCFTLIAISISFWLMNKHLAWYTNKPEQRYIVRILLMVPIYAVVSLASYLFWNHSTPLLLLRDGYESTVLTSFFYLLLLYISPDPEEQKEVFRKHGLSKENDKDKIRAGEPPKKWMFPLSSARWKPDDGLYFLQLMKWGVLQYCVIRPTTTLAAVILDYVGLYCEDSWSPGWGHFYIETIVSISVTIAMYCLIQLYIPISVFLAPHQPLLKLVAIKAVVFLTFWQATGLSMLSTFGLVKDTQYMTAENINIGLGAILETFEMMLFALLHLKAFTYKPYVIPPHRTRRLHALIHAFNFMETYREVRSGVIYVYYRMLGRETDILARRQGVMEGIFGKSRIEIQGHSFSASEKDRRRALIEPSGAGVKVDVEETVHIGEERQWLGVGNDYAYGLGYHSRPVRERSDGLKDQIEKELIKRGYNGRASNDRRGSSGYGILPNHEPEPVMLYPQPSGEQSWLRGIYKRLSHSDPAPLTSHRLDAGLTTDHGINRGRRRSKRWSKLKSVELTQQTYDDPPPPSAIRTYRDSKQKSRETEPVEVSSTQLPGLQAKPADDSSSPTPSPVALPQIPVDSPHRMSLSAAPFQSDTAITSTASLPTLSSRTDSFFGRAFPSPSGTSHSNEAISSANASSQSHHIHVRLVPGPIVLPAQAPRAVKRKPVRYSAPVLSPTTAMNAAVEEDQVHAEDRRVVGTRSYHRRPTGGKADLQVASYGERRLQDSRTSSLPVSTTGTASTRRYALRRDQIVLPAPLAPSQTGHPTLNTIPPLPASPSNRPSTLTSTPLHIPGQPRRSSHDAFSLNHRYQDPASRRSPQLRRSPHRRYSHTFAQPPLLTGSNVEHRQILDSPSPRHDNLSDEHISLDEDVGLAL